MLYIMRHGKTEWNQQHKLQGRTDIPLNDEGRKMAEAAHTEYLDVHFDVCYTSPLIRAKETAEIVLRDRNVPIITDDRLVEMSFGCYEGLANIFQIPDCPITYFLRNLHHTLNLLVEARLLTNCSHVPVALFQRL